MGYREDGDFGINWNERASDKGISNPPFIYPSRSIRFLEAEHALAARGHEQAVAGGTYKLHRGYIRNLDQPALAVGLNSGATVPISKCHFQFNPQDIQQNVAMREDMYLTILQTPEQLAQPVGAVMNFQFDLLFDRSAEVAAGNKRFADDSSANGIEADVLGEFDQSDVYDIGVMADLRVLYSVIGQGFSQEMLNFQIESLKVNAATYAEANPEDQGTDGAADGADSEDTTTDQTDSAAITFDDAAAEEIVRANFGNSAFIMPNPVRVMFSSLFMLDGFITATKVEFLKFNTQMVPLQCKVYLSMSAMYIGFAQQDTFLTRSFKSAAEVRQAEESQKAADKAQVLAALQKTGSVFTAVFTSEPTDDDGDIDSAFNNQENENSAWIYVVSDKAGDTNTDDDDDTTRAAYYGFKNVVPVEGGETIRDEETGEETRTGADIDDILKLFEPDNAIGLTISYTVSLKMYGLKSGSTGLTESQATTALANGSFSQSTNSLGIKLMGSYTFTETASSKQQWGAGASGNAGADKIRRRSRHASEDNENFPNEAADKFNYGSEDDVSDSIKNSYYIYVISVNVTATTTSGVSLNSSKSTNGVVKGNSYIGAKNLELTWR